MNLWIVVMQILSLPLHQQPIQQSTDHLGMLWPPRVYPYIRHYWKLQECQSSHDICTPLCDVHGHWCLVVALVHTVDKTIWLNCQTIVGMNIQLGKLWWKTFMNKIWFWIISTYKKWKSKCQICQYLIFVLYGAKIHCS